jgi:hypothetical protein
VDRQLDDNGDRHVHVTKESAKQFQRLRELKELDDALYRAGR